MSNAGIAWSMPECVRDGYIREHYTFHRDVDPGMGILMWFFFQNHRREVLVADASRASITAWFRVRGT